MAERRYYFSCDPEDAECVHLPEGEFTLEEILQDYEEITGWLPTKHILDMEPGDRRSIWVPHGDTCHWVGIYVHCVENKEGEDE